MPRPPRAPAYGRRPSFDWVRVAAWAGAMVVSLVAWAGLGLVVLALVR